MTPPPRPTVVTGGLGFIGSAFVRGRARRGLESVVVDARTYAADGRRLDDVRGAFALHEVDITDPSFVDLIAEMAPEVVVHFAAETHVTRSESDPDRFYATNVEGTHNVFEGALRARAALVVHVSTDEVYGPCPGEPFKEEDKEPGERLATSAYARSKALADDLAQSYFARVATIVVRPTNCFGPYQHPEKAIPRWAIRALRGERVPVWGDGGQIRDWMYVDDACSALDVLVERGAAGSVYNIAPSDGSRTNLEIARTVASFAGAPDAVYLTAYDRPDHDRRYAVDAQRLRGLGWQPSAPLDERLQETVAWYEANHEWWEPFVADAERLYDDERERV